ncbi:hypothetical protein [Streptosporangium lutulentum]|uniref:Prenyltransferase and squalene oxidase repeat-containing protein n=1 Tax=Streptosporangium lutulentum TaxID=1461250 RepID=A0ABT9Q6Y4_9ACTN|nr:hypothetical protein [Streptosporangium lutulentum]MDP9841704.1 hypothetical protein [Streptosporangium lutulentum]
MNDSILDTAGAFILREGRLLEQRLFATLFQAEPATGVVDSLRGYQNSDGGFGHGLEPDKRCPDSLPIDVEIAFQTLTAAGCPPAERMVSRACDWLAAVSAPDGAVPLAFPVMEAYPRAVHWSDWTYAPGLNPTAGLAGLLHRMGADHPWLTRATDWCWAALEKGFPDDAHAMSETLVFLEHVPDRDRAERVAERVGEWLPKLNHYRADPADPAYGLTPLHLAPTPDSRWRRLFADDLIEGHLDRLAGDQRPDGGWPITWEPPGAASTLEYRGIETLRALRVLTAYGRG